MAGKGTAQMAGQHHINRPEFNNCNSNETKTKRTLLVYGTAFILFSVFVLKLPSADATQLQPRQDANANRSGGKICQSVDIRNSFSSNDNLRGCTVVEGFVQILLFDNVNETEMANISYPELVEITDYLLLYRVNGLRSIGQLFPNLTVIRGQVQFYAYSLVIFEMPSLMEIGLHSLTEISSGSVRIDKNPLLCFVNTIDWNEIAREKGTSHFMPPSKPDNDCPVCPGAGDKPENDKDDIKACPVGIIQDKKKNLCWNLHSCQKICPEDCKTRTCNNLGKCCDPSCIGGCSDHDTKQCTICRNFIVAPNKCASKCPPNKYKFLERRCVTKEECMTMEASFRPQQQSYKDSDLYPYKIFGDKCVLECPPNYMSENQTCKPCLGKCQKECPGTNVDSIKTAQSLRGCTHITGPLEIQIRGGRKVVSVLEENLSMIEVIDDYLKIVRSFPLISLSFLKNLKQINGYNLESQKYSFIVLDNQNLQSIWDWKNRTLSIKNGKLFFHFNPKLCLELIDELQNKTGLPPYTDLEVAKNSNGDKIACNTTELIVNYTVNSTNVLLTWKQFKIDDQRKLLGYIVYTIEAPSKNVTLYDGRDACGEEDWKVDDVAVPEDPEVPIRHPITNLKPYTQYAFYVKTYTIATERRGAQSRIQYFRTNPDRPSAPRNVHFFDVQTNSLKVSWQPPLHRNGLITHYLVYGKKQINTQNELFDRNYCDRFDVVEPIITITTTEPPPLPAEKINNTDKCPCGETKESRLSIEEEQSRIQFEDELHNQVYVRKSDPIPPDSSGRTKRGTETKQNDNQSDLLSTTSQKNNSVNINSIDILNETEKSEYDFNYTVIDATEKFIDNLHHFTTYQIYVLACRRREENETAGNELCSAPRINNPQRTRKKEGADNIVEIWKTNQTLDSVTISWKQPPDPNGVILSVRVEYKEVINGRFVYPERRCIQSKDLKNGTNSYTLSNLSAGNYSIRVVAISSAGDGDPSRVIYVYIEGPSSQILIIVVTVVVLMLILIAAIVYLVYQKRFKGEKDRLIPSVNPEYVSSVYVPDEWEVPRKKIELIKELGQGSFGMVYEGIAKNICGNAVMRCAVKTVNEHATNRERDEFLNEASVMKAFDTAHVVRLLGVVSQSQPTLVIMELMANGDLKSYLRSHRPDDQAFDPTAIRHPPTLKQIYGMAIEIADGMAYLSAKKFVHRDLAARNCMVAEDLTVKIGDFGMTRDIYETDYYRKGTKGLLPVRWMAPESLKDGVFTSSSDVWSYGVVLWEMATLASQPYQGLSNEQVLRYVIDGGVMERPEKCPDKLYTLMRLCWQHKPSERPSFLKLCSLLIDEAKPNFISVSFYHSAAGLEARMNRPTPSPSQDEQTTPLRTAAGYTPSDSQESDAEIDIPTNTHIQFPSITNGSDRLTTANGYVSGCPSNGAGTSQC